jgi:hypothetical protein
MTLPRRIWCTTVATVALSGWFSVAGPLAASHASAAIGAPRAPTALLPDLDGVSSELACAEDCTRRAADCLDGCEEKFKDDDKGRVTCKFECATKRQQCEKDCG